MKKMPIHHMINLMKLRKEPVTLLGIGPLSKTIINAAIESAKENDYPLFLIASRNQIEKREMGGGYVEGWSQGEFCRYVAEQVVNLGFDGLVYNCRDHGGPWQKDEEYSQKTPEKISMENAFESFKADIDSGFDLLHIDTSKDPHFPQMVPFETAIERIITILSFTEQYRKSQSKDPIAYEVSLEETNGNYSVVEQFDQFIGLLIKKIDQNHLPRPVFVVGQTGTLTRMDQNVGKFNQDIVIELKDIAKKYDMVFKQHNTDYLDTKFLKLHPQLEIGMANIAPEFGKLETEALMELAGKESDYIGKHQLENVESSNLGELILNNLKNSGKWKKWLVDKEQGVHLFGDPKFNELIIKINGHYFYSKDDFKKAKELLYQNLRKFNIESDPELYVKNHVKKGIQRYVDAFNLKKLTSKLLDSQHQLKNSTRPNLRTGMSQNGLYF